VLFRSLQLAADYRSVSARQSFAAAEGIEYGAHAASSVGRLHDGTLVASTSRGLFRWDTAAARFVADDLGGLAPLRRYPELLLHVQTAPTGEDWAFNQWELFSRPVGGAWQREDLRDAFSGTIDDLTFDTDGSPILTATSVVLHGDRQQRGSPGMTPLVQLRAVEQVQGATRQRLPLVASPPAFEASALGGLDFQVGLPEYRRGQPVRYRARLLGQGDVEFSDWSESGHFSYRNLKPGDYRFEARARDVQGMVTAIAPYAFSVLPPWHATAWGRLLLGSLALLLLAAGNAAVLRLRTRALRREQGRLESLVVQRTRDLESANRQLHGLAYLDALTQVPNRRRLDEYLAEVWQQCLQHGREMSVIVLDGDGFKRYNDVQGHEAGDRLICQIATVLSGSLRRAEDLLARYGGVEFVVVLPGAPAAQALQVAEHMRQRIEAEQLPVTLSAGVATRRPLEGASVTDLTQAADEALYEAKRRGRNCVVMAPEA
jgi:diguanylate cyclase (GGDEF)-like protein